MFYIFEDHDNSRLMRLFRQGYKQEDTSNFICTKGNGSILESIKVIIEQYGLNTEIVVYLDAVPDNKNTILAYNTIYDYLKENPGHRVVLLPIPCMEYYFIKSIQGQQVETNKDWVKACINRQWWRDTSIIETEKDQKFCKSFEKFCKLVQIKAVKECARQQGNSVTYFEVDCSKQENCFAKCKNETKDFKCARFLSQFPCVPCNQIIRQFTQDIHNLEFKDLIKIQEQVVKEYNTQADLYTEKLLETQYKGMRKLPKKARIGHLKAIEYKLDD